MYGAVLGVNKMLAMIDAETIRFWIEVIVAVLLILASIRFLFAPIIYLILQLKEKE